MSPQDLVGQIAELITLLVIFLIAVTKMPDQSTFKKAGSILAHGSMTSRHGGRSQRQLGHIVLIVRKHSVHFSPFFFSLVSQPVD